MTEASIASALAKHHAGSEWAFLTQVRNSTGFQRTVRTADALAISLWPSRGIYAQGYEIKISRGDLRKELATPEKAEEIARFCRHWFVATPEGLCKPEELPETWGLVEVKADGKLRWAKPAKPNTAAADPSWLFCASVLRNIGQSMVPNADLNRLVEANRVELLKHYDLKAKSNLSLAEKQLDSLQSQVATFERMSGVRLDRYSDHFNRKIGSAVAILQHYTEEGGPAAELLRVEHLVRKMADDLARTIEILKTQEPIPAQKAELSEGN